MHFFILPDHQNHVLQKGYFLTFRVVDAFAYTYSHQNHVIEKKFLTSGVVKHVFWCICAYIHVLKNFFCDVWSWETRVLMHLCIIPDHQKLRLKKDIYPYSILGVVKTCFDAFAYTYRTPESCHVKNFLWLREWWNTCFDAYFQTTRNIA
jgi:hypothetical protein